MPVSPARVVANRRNALKSTGPRTRAGKRTCSANARRHGLLASSVLDPGETLEEFESFQQAMRADLLPVGELETALADRIIGAAWRLRRVARIEAGLFTVHACQQIGRERSSALELLAMSDPPRFEEHGRLGKRAGVQLVQSTPAATEILGPQDAAFAAGFAAAAGQLAILIRYETTLERGLYRAVRELQRLQIARSAQSDFCETNPTAAPGQGSASLADLKPVPKLPGGGRLIDRLALAYSRHRSQLPFIDPAASSDYPPRPYQPPDG